MLVINSAFEIRLENAGVKFYSPHFPIKGQTLSNSKKKKKKKKKSIIYNKNVKKLNVLLTLLMLELLFRLV